MDSDLLDLFQRQGCCFADATSNNVRMNAFLNELLALFENFACQKYYAGCTISDLENNESTQSTPQEIKYIRTAHEGYKNKGELSRGKVGRGCLHLWVG